MTFQAVWNGTVLAESDQTIVVEGNHYFPPSAIDRTRFFESKLHTRCPWKGRASYYSVESNGQVNTDAAWYYPKPWPLARRIKGYVAFWNGVTVQERSP
jgi:uncharacterized protein (DUF427 family)